MKFRAAIRQLKRRLPKPQPRVIRVSWVCPAEPDVHPAQKEDDQTHTSSTNISSHGGKVRHEQETNDILGLVLDPRDGTLGS